MATKDKLKVLVHSSLIGQTEIQALEVAGHEVFASYEAEGMVLDEFDLVLGPNCWRVTPDLVKFTKNAVTAAKNTKKRRAKKNAG
jgi:hypothetical protein